jgi:hypothetical protein
MGHAIEGAALNASLAVGAQMASSSMDVSESLEGLGMLIAVSGGLGAAAGGLSTFAKGAHTYVGVRHLPTRKPLVPDELKPNLPDTSHLATVARPMDAGELPVGVRVTDANGTRWEVTQTEDGKQFRHVRGPLPEAEPAAGRVGEIDEQAVVEGAGARFEAEEEIAAKVKTAADTPLTKEQTVVHSRRGWVGGDAEPAVKDVTAGPERIVSKPAPGVPVDENGRPYTTVYFDHRGQERVNVDGRTFHAGAARAGAEIMDENGVLWRNDGSKLWRYVSHNTRPQTPEEVAAQGRRGFLDVEPKRLVDMEFAPGELPSVLDDAIGHPLENGDTSIGRSVSAAMVPGAATSLDKARLKAEGLAPTGIGLEGLGTSPGMRGVNSPSLIVRQIVMRQADTGGLKQNKNVAEKIGLTEKVPVPSVPNGHFRVWYSGDQLPNGVSDFVVSAFPDYARGQNAINGTPIHYADIPSNSPWLSQLDRKSRLNASTVTGDVAHQLEELIETRPVLSEKSSVPVEAKIAQKWRPVMMIAEQKIRGAWLEARAKLAGAPISEAEGREIGRSFIQQGRDLFGGDPNLKFGAFRERVTFALADGFVDRVNDGMTPHVITAARALHEANEAVRKAADANDVNLFRAEAEKSLQKLEERRKAYVDGQADKGDTPNPMVMGQFANMENVLKNTIQNGPHQSNSVNYVTSIYRQDKLAAMPDKFMTILSDWIFDSTGRAGLGVTRLEADKAARMAFDKITGTKSQSVADFMDEMLDEIDNPSGAKARTLDIPRNLIEEFLENDSIMLLRYHVTQMGSAIETAREFGDVNMTRQMKDIADDYKRMIDNEPDVRKRVELLRRRDQDLEDVQTLRDRLLNIEGASKDPHSWTERTYRVLKNYMSWTSMGLSAFSQMADFPRTVLTEGLDATFRYGFGSLIDSSRKTIMEMIGKERLHAGDVLELSTASGALSFANIGDTMHSRSALERSANKLSGLYFMANGLTWMTEQTRNWAALSIMGNMNASLVAWGKAIEAGTKFDDQRTIAKFLALGIDGNDALRMYKELKTHSFQAKSLMMPNTEYWKDAGAQELYRQAFVRQMNRTVVTKGAFEQPTFMSSGIGSLIAQFKSFGFTSYSKTLVAGLQDNDRQFWTGMATLTGAGIVLNEIKNQIFFDRSTFDQPYLGILADGLNTGGALGSIMDLNNMVEMASRNKLGLRPMVGAGRNTPVTPEAMASTFLGPSAGKAALGAKLLGEYMSGNATARTWRDTRGFVPGQNLPYVDWWMDMMFPKGQKLVPKNKKLPEGALS